jgi:hypothetical protein
MRYQQSSCFFNRLKKICASKPKPRTKNGRNSLLKRMSEHFQTGSDEQQFALQVRGFREHPPEAQQRIRAFCIDELNLTVDEAVRILSSGEEATLYRSSSLDRVQRLAHSLEQHGVRVRVSHLNQSSRPDSDLRVLDTDLSEIVPHLEVLTRAPVLRFEHADLQDAPVGAVAPSLDGPVQGAQPVRQADELAEARGGPRIRTVRARTRARRRDRLSGVQAVGVLLAGMAGLMAVNSALLGPASLRGGDRIAFLPQEARASSNILPLPHRPLGHSGGQRLDGSLTREDFVLTLSVAVNERTASARMLLVPIRDTALTADTPGLGRLRRAESDTTLLHEQAPGVWSGELVTYLFVQSSGIKRRVPFTTRVTVATNPESGAVSATISAAAQLQEIALAPVAGFTSPSGAGSGTSVRLQEQLVLTPEDA